MNLMSNIPNFNSSSLFDQEKLNSIDPLENQLCRVCEEPAAGFHFGAFTCEGCKSFFGRSCNNQTVIQECKNNYRCVVDRKNRTSCKACRLRKCLLVGMSKSGCRYGRRSNWFKIHCLMQKNVSKPSAAPYPMFPQNPRLGNADAILNHADAILNSVKPSQSRSPSPLNNSSESLSIHSSPSPSAPLEAPVSPPTFSLAPSMLYDQPPSMVERHSLYKMSPSMLDQYNSHHKIASSPASLLEQQQHSLYKLSPLLAVHPLLLAANPLFKMDFSAQLEILKQRRAMFEALRSSGPEQENGPATTETPIDLSCK